LAFNNENKFYPKYKECSGCDDETETSFDCGHIICYDCALYLSLKIQECPICEKKPKFCNNGYHEDDDDDFENISQYCVETR
jgi:hypothetical protein